MDAATVLVVFDSLTTIAAPHPTHHCQTSSRMPSPALKSFEKRLRNSSTAFAQAQQRYERKDSKPDRKGLKSTLTAALENICDWAREAVAPDSGLTQDELHRFLKRASDYETKLVDYAYGPEDIFDFLPPSCGNVVEDNAGIGLFIFAMILRTVNCFS